MRVRVRVRVRVRKCVWARRASVHHSRIGRCDPHACQEADVKVCFAIDNTEPPQLR